MPERHAARRSAIAFPIILFLMLASACGVTRQDTLQHAMTTANAAATGFTTWDGLAQARIVEQATSLEDGEARLDAYRARRERVVRAFAVVYKAIAAAALDADAPLADVVKALTDLYAAISIMQSPANQPAAAPDATPATPTATPPVPPAPGPAPGAAPAPTTP